MEKGLKRICLIAVEIFAWGKHGGYGKTARIIGRELARRGYEVHAVVPRRKGQKAEEMLDGIIVHSYPIKSFLSSGTLCKKINADIYFSLEPSLSTSFAMRSMPGAVHLISSQDPKYTSEWIQEWMYPSKNRLQVIKNYIFENNFLVRKAMKQADGVFVPAKFLIEKVRKRYHLSQPVQFLPTPTELPVHTVKATHPTVLYMGRLDKRKRPQLALQLAKEFPNVKFKVAGKSRTLTFEADLKKEFGHLPNVDFLGFVDQFEGNQHHQLYSEAWIHINTSIREGLPNSFIEAAGHQCAILSHVNPDSFASAFGFHVTGVNYREGLRWLLQDNRWKDKGLEGYQYVSANYELNKAIDAHEVAFLKAFEQHQKK